MSKMEIRVEFLAGTDLSEAVEEAKEKARMFQIAYILFNFNGVSFSIGQNADVEEALNRYHAGDTKYGICQA